MTCRASFVQKYLLTKYFLWAQSFSVHQAGKSIFQWQSVKTDKQQLEEIALVMKECGSMKKWTKVTNSRNWRLLGYFFSLNCIQNTLVDRLLHLFFKPIPILKRTDALCIFTLLQLKASPELQRGCQADSHVQCGAWAALRGQGFAVPLGLGVQTWKQ